MKKNLTILSTAAALSLTLFTGSALAQDAAEPPAEAPVAEQDEEAAATAAPVEEPTPEPAEEPAPEPVEEEEEAAPAEEETVEEAAEEEAAPAEEEATGGTPSLMVFADAWMGFQTAKSGVGAGGDVYSSNGPGGTAESGFGLSWLGADLGYDGGKWAVNGSLRFGDALPIYGTGTLGPITNAYATWKPVDGLAIDAGAFGTIYGAEVAESWMNLNYTRGELYFNMQPFWHTGLRAQYEVGNFVVRGLAVNDANSSNLGEGAVNVGLQGGYSNDTVGLVVGALQSLAPETTARPKFDSDGDGVLDAGGGFVDTFIDVVGTLALGDLSVVGNFDMNLGYEADQFWGVSLAAGYAFTDSFGLALRGEYLASPDGFLYGTTEDSLITGTFTIDTKPVPGVENFIVRWDNRVEMASEEAYTNLANDDTTDTWFTSVIGVVGYADLL